MIKISDKIDPIDLEKIAKIIEAIKKLPKIKEATSTETNFQTRDAAPYIRYRRLVRC